MQKFNQKNSKIISFKNQKKEKNSFFLDYCSSTDKKFEIVTDNNNPDKNENNIFQFLHYTTKSLEFIVLIRPIANFTNYTPFNISLSNNKNNCNIFMNKLETISLSDELLFDNSTLLKFEMIYNNEKFETDFLSLKY